MFDIAWSELMLIGAVALVVIGPKDLPKAMRTVGQAVGKIRRMAGEFQGQFNDAMREAELHELKKQVEDVGGSVSTAMNPDYKPIEMPKDDFGITDPPTSTVSAGLDDAAMKEAEAKLAALPGPEPLPEIVFDPAPAAEPTRRRTASADSTPPPVDTDLPEPRAPRKRKAKVSEPDDGSAA
ncbi:MAG: Sec-independent protein translocase protein TatB [Beijerinckiaceae bacterium]|nr:Sec-independent protein translocase protein TatB [Beijerinckiaceae bacterium]